VVIAPQAGYHQADNASPPFSEIQQKQEIWDHYSYPATYCLVKDLIQPVSRTFAHSNPSAL
jgi:hypothetical protein